MDIITNKAKEEFLKEYYKESFKNNWNLEELEYIFNILPQTCQNALIIEWFDSIGIYINISVTYGFNWYINELGGEDYNNRQEATKQAIIKANEIYNLKFGE